jgi:hypothetical protein
MVSYVVAAKEAMTDAEQVVGNFLIPVLPQGCFCFSENAEVTKALLKGTGSGVSTRLIWFELDANVLEGPPVPHHTLIHCVRMLRNRLETSFLQTGHDDTDFKSSASRVAA